MIAYVLAIVFINLSLLPFALPFALTDCIVGKLSYIVVLYIISFLCPHRLAFFSIAIYGWSQFFVLSSIFHICNESSLLWIKFTSWVLEMPERQHVVKVTDKSLDTYIFNLLLRPHKTQTTLRSTTLDNSFKIFNWNPNEHIKTLTIQRHFYLKEWEMT